MKDTVDIPLGNYVKSGSSLELVDVFILSVLFNPVCVDSVLQINKKTVMKSLSVYSISWDRLKKRLSEMNNLGYIQYKVNNNDLEIIVLKNTELLFHGLKVEEFKKDTAPRIVSINETLEETNYMEWLCNGSMKHSTYVTKAKSDIPTRLKLIESYRRLRKTHTKEDVFHAITFAVRDEFWRKNFLSPLKLEQVQQSSGMKYIDVFISSKNAIKPVVSSPAQKKETNTRSID